MAVGYECESLVGVGVLDVMKRTYLLILKSVEFADGNIEFGIDIVEREELASLAILHVNHSCL